MDRAPVFRPARSSIHPLHAILLAFVFPLFLGALLSDLAYWRTYEIQWSNFAQWLNAGGLVAGAFAIVAAVIGMIRRRNAAGRRPVIYGLVLAVAWLAGLVSAFVHARDAWAMMPDALVWSAVSTGLSLAASWMAYGGFPATEVR